MVGVVGAGLMAAQIGLFARQLGVPVVLTDLDQARVDSGEIGFVLDEGVVAAPEDIDLCMIMGAGWPSHLGGITPYLDRTGIAEKVTGLPSREAWGATGRRPLRAQRRTSGSQGEWLCYSPNQITHCPAEA